MEFRINVDVDSVVPKAITFNYDELDAELTQMLSKYSNIKVTDDNFKECKDIRARINKLVKSFKDERIAIKKKLLSPIDDFSNKIDLLVGKCNMVSGFINEGIKKIESERKPKRQSNAGACKLTIDVVGSGDKLMDLYEYIEGCRDKFDSVSMSLTEIH